jgi:hypothetical protein
VQRLNAELVKILDMPDTRRSFAEQGADVQGGTPTRFDANCGRAAGRRGLRPGRRSRATRFRRSKKVASRDPPPWRLIGRISAPPRPAEGVGHIRHDNSLQNSTFAHELALQICPYTAFAILIFLLQMSIQKGVGNLVGTPPDLRCLPRPIRLNLL